MRLLGGALTGTFPHGFPSGAQKKLRCLECQDFEMGV